MLPALLLLTIAMGSPNGSSASQPAEIPAASPPLFSDAPFDFGKHVSGRSGKLHLVEMMGAGVGLFDADSDGDLDVLVLGGGALDSGLSDCGLADCGLADCGPAATSGGGARLYRNLLVEEGRLGFRDVTADSGLAEIGYGYSIAAGDIDEDGDVDLYFASYGQNQLWRNRGDGRFENITATAGTGLGDPRWSTAATFFDYNRDGLLDLYVANYLDYPLTKAPPCFAASSRRDYCGPNAFSPVTNSLFRNLGGGRFEDVSLQSGIAAVAGSSLGVVALDYNRDGWADLYVANDGEANELWRNSGQGRFSEEALLAGAALNADGQPEASMGIAVGDFDEDGDEDLFLTHLQREKNTLYVNLGDGGFTDRSAALSLAAPSLPFTSFGTTFLDFDHDGWLDLVTVSGAVKLLDELLAQGDPIALAQSKQLFRNQEGRRFEDFTPRGGESFARLEVSRGLAVGDVDNDGDTDLLVGNHEGPFRLLLAKTPENSPWLGLRLVTGQRDALLARVELRRKNAPTLHRTVRVDGSYGATSDPRLLMGLGGGSAVEAVWVTWPDGRRERFSPPPLRTYTTLRQGSGTALP